MPEKILVVDDDLETLRLVSLMLQRQGYQILSAPNGAQALSMARNNLPDLIVLDIMMPDMDGYEVTRQLRDNPDTANIPILMFTAKSQVEDKVTGYDVGADDYLTKPIHPAELVAHIKALLARVRTMPAAPAPAAPESYTIGVVSAKGGTGVSTLAFNLAVSLFQKSKKDIVAAELRPGQGTWAMELNLQKSDGLKNLLEKRLTEINVPAIERELFKTSYGVRLLLSPSSMQPPALDRTEKLGAIAQQISRIGNIVLLDVGTCVEPAFTKILQHCNEIIFVTEPHPLTVKRTQQLLEEVKEATGERTKFFSLVLLNRTRSDTQLNAIQVEEMMGGIHVEMMVPAAPEQAYHANQTNVPLVFVQPNGLVAQQFNQLSDIILSHLPQ